MVSAVHAGASGSPAGSHGWQPAARHLQAIKNCSTHPVSCHAAAYASSHCACLWRQFPACALQVGHIVGLGDRHCENIMIDAACGDCVHIDFGIMFDKVGAPAGPGTQVLPAMLLLACS